MYGRTSLGGCTLRYTPAVPAGREGGRPSCRAHAAGIAPHLRITAGFSACTSAASASFFATCCLHLLHATATNYLLPCLHQASERLRHTTSLYSVKAGRACWASQEEEDTSCLGLLLEEVQLPHSAGEAMGSEGGCRPQEGRPPWEGDPHCRLDQEGPLPLEEGLWKEGMEGGGCLSPAFSRGGGATLPATSGWKGGEAACHLGGGGGHRGGRWEGASGSPGRRLGGGHLCHWEEFLHPHMGPAPAHPGRQSSTVWKEREGKSWKATWAEEESSAGLCLGGGR